MDSLYLAGDIGGTKTRLALYSPKIGPHKPFVDKTYLSNDFPSLESIVQEFLVDRSEKILSASLGVAGPVIQGRSRITNLRWVIDAKKISQEIDNAPVDLLNDMQSIAFAIPNLKSTDLEQLVPGDPDPQGTIGIVAPGTGLGEGFLVWIGNSYKPFPSEGGHASFGPETSEQLQLLNFLLPRFGHVSFERVCSGIGIINLYTFLKEGVGLEEPEWLRQQLMKEEDLTPVIVQNGLNRRAEICMRALDLFTSILGSEAGNLALKVLATGGIYLGGGLPPRIMPILRQSTFQQSFTSKGRFSTMLTKVPVYVILHPQAGLFGAACHAQSKYSQTGS
jgi:glucokinase